MRLRIIVFAALASIGMAFFLTEFAFGSGPPDWIQKPPPEDGDFFYFVGFGEDESLASARKLADDDARQKVVQQFSGVYSEFNQRTNETTHAFESSKTSELQSDLIQIRGLKEIESYRESERKKAQVYILFALPKGEADVLRAKVSSRPDGKLSLAAIASTPTGATAKIDGRNVGKTPFKIFLPVGRTDISLHLEGFKLFKQSFHVERGKDLQVDYALERLMGTVNVGCIPGSAVIEWNGVAISSFANVDVPAGQYELKVSIEGKKSVTMHGTLQPGKTKEFCVNLADLPKPKKTQPKKKSENKEESLQEEVDRAFRLANRHLYKKALAVASHLEERAPKDPVVHAIRAQVFVLTEFYAKAYREQAAYLVATRNEEFQKSARSFLCYIGGMDAQFGSGSTRSESHRECEKALDENPMNAFGHMGMALIFERQRQYREARNSFQTAASLDSQFKSEKKAFCHRNRYHHEFYFGGC